MKLRTILLLASLLFILGCEEETELSLVEKYNLETLPPIPYPPNNKYKLERVELGRLLFYDPILGGEKNVSCGTCHHPDFAFGDGRQFGAGTSGVGLGPDRILGNSNITGDPIPDEPRNSPTIFNTAYNQDEYGNYTHFGIMFLDGRVSGLEEQAKKPITSRAEMAGDAYADVDALDSIILRLRAIPEYIDLFEKAFPLEPSGQQIINGATYGKAIASFERELVTTNSPYDQFVNGNNDALSEQQKRGLVLFFEKAKCATCHSGAMFSDFKFIVNGVPQEGEGKKAIPGDDAGRMEHTGYVSDIYAFRNLTLRNIALTAPYMHDGVFETLEEVIQFYNNGAKPRHSQIPDSAMPDVLTSPLGLTDTEVADLVAFLNSLTDNGTQLPNYLMTVPDEVPSGLIPVFGN